MLPDNNDQHHDTPKRFNLGYYTRETFDLFQCGWKAASRNLKEYYRLEDAKETRKYIVELLEEGLYDNVSRGTVEEKLNALRYFQRKKEFEQIRDQHPYTLGKQISSVALNAAFLSAIAVMFSFSATWSCGKNQSQFCKDIRSTTGEVVRYFADPKI
jgi:hypothetical protein